MKIRRDRYRSKREHNIKYINYIATLINTMAGIDVFAKSRKVEVVEMRSLFVYILREVEEMTYYEIRDYFASNGKSLNHATALHSFRNYEMYKKYNPKIGNYFNTLVSKSTTEKARKIHAKALIDSCSVVDAEMFTYMIQQKSVI